MTGGLTRGENEDRGCVVVGFVSLDLSLCVLTDHLGELGGASFIISNFFFFYCFILFHPPSASFILFFFYSLYLFLSLSLSLSLVSRVFSPSYSYTVFFFETVSNEPPLPTTMHFYIFYFFISFLFYC